MHKYLVVFAVESGKEKFIEKVEIEASSEISAQNGAYKIGIIKKYSGKGYRCFVVSTEIIDV